MADKMATILMNKKRLEQMSLDARKCVEDNYDWNKLWKQWEFVFDNVSIKPRQGTWDSPIEIIESVTPKDIPDNLSDEAFIDWLYVEILKYPRTDPQGAKMWMAHLQQGVQRQQLLDHFVNLGNSQSNAGNMRQKIRAEVSGNMGEVSDSKQVQSDWID
jgi:hypothetical protein